MDRAQPALTAIRLALTRRQLALRVTSAPKVPTRPRLAREARTMAARDCMTHVAARPAPPVTTVHSWVRLATIGSITCAMLASTALEALAGPSRRMTRQDRDVPPVATA